MGQVEEGGPRPCGVGGNFQLKYGDDRIFVLLTARGARALKVAWLIERGACEGNFQLKYGDDRIFVLLQAS